MQLSINDLTRSIDIYCDKADGRYFLYDGQGTWDLDNEDSEDGGYDTIEDVIDRIDSLWYGWITEDLEDEFGCEEDFSDLEEVLDWMTENQDVIYPETYSWYKSVIEAILDPSSVIDDAVEQDD